LNLVIGKPANWAINANWLTVFILTGKPAKRVTG